MKGNWLIEFREAEVWAWACHEALLLRLHRCGLGAICDLQAQCNVGEFRWQTPGDALDFDFIEGAAWVALLEAQLAADDSDLSLARRFHALTPSQRTAQLLAFERGTRADFERALAFMLQQPELMQLASGQHRSLFQINFRIDDERLLTWHCSGLLALGSGGQRFPKWRAKVQAICEFFEPHRDRSLGARRLARVEHAPFLFELHAPLKWSLPIAEQPLTAHETLEGALQLRELFARHLAPAAAAALLDQILPASLTFNP